jgi:hypothetical protein
VGHGGLQEAALGTTLKPDLVVKFNDRARVYLQAVSVVDVTPRVLSLGTTGIAKASHAKVFKSVLYLGDEGIARGAVADSVA